MEYCRICGEPNCKKHAFLIGRIKNIKEFSGSSPPEIFIGHYGYPNVNIGILSPQNYGDTGILSSPEEWHKQHLKIQEIVGLRKEVSKCCKAPIKKDKPREYYCSKCNQKVLVSSFRRSKDEWKIKPLQADQFDYARKLLFIKGAKGNKDRNIPISPNIKPSYLKELPIELSQRALEIAFKNVVHKTLNKSMHFHCLRHSAGTYYLMDKKWNIRFVQQFLGHSNISTTQIYTHVSPQDMVEAMWDKK